MGMRDGFLTVIVFITNVGRIGVASIIYLINYNTAGLFPAQS